MPDLFDSLPPAAATADPATSHAAARELERSGALRSQAEEVAALVARFPGCTARELAEAGNVDRYMVARRLSTCERVGTAVRGKPRVCRASPTRKTAETWWPVEGAG